MTTGDGHLPWSATTCEVCHGTGELNHRYNTETHEHDECPPELCWYCNGDGWYEAAL